MSRFEAERDGTIRLNSLNGYTIGVPSKEKVVALHLETHGRSSTPSQELQCLLTPAQAVELGARLQEAAYRQE